MKQLPLEIKHSRITLRQIKRSDNVAMYSVSQSGGVEVIKIGHAKAATFVRDGVTITTEEQETYPNSEAFGSRGWYFTQPERQNAEKRYAMLLETASQPRTKKEKAHD